MNSIHRLGASVAAVAAVATVAGALFVQAYTSGQQAAARTTAQTTVANAASGTTPPLGPQIVYVNPAPSPQVVTVTQAQPAAQPPVIHVVVPGVGGDDNGGADD